VRRLLVEEWKNIVVGVVDIGYQVSNLGKVRMNPVAAFILGKSLLRRKPVKYHKSKGYKKVKLPTPDGGHRWFYVHLLVMEYFGTPKPFDGALVNHEDGNKQNCRLDNLEWTTHSGNTQHAYDMGLAKGKKGSTHHNSKLTEWDVGLIRMAYKGGAKITELAERFGVSRKLIYNIVKRKAWQHV
jgi:hypothetical protein